MHYRGFAFEYKMHKVGSPLSLYLENTRQDQENNKIHEWHGSRWELTQSWQEIRQIKTKDNVNMTNNIDHIYDYQLSRDKKYLEIILGGRMQRYPTSSPHPNTQANLQLVELTFHLGTR